MFIIITLILADH